MMDILADSIFLIHMIITAFVLLAPFSDRLSFLILHVTFAATLMLHWATNSNICCLSLLESWVRKVELSQTFLNRIIEPVYVISEYKLSMVIWSATALLACVSLYKVVNHPNITKLMECKDFVSCVKALN